MDSNGNCGTLMPFQSTFAVPENCCGCLLFLTPDAMQGFTYSARSTPKDIGNTELAREHPSADETPTYVRLSSRTQHNRLSTRCTPSKSASKG